MGDVVDNAQSPRDHFFVLTMARSGSTWLQQTLNAHPDVTCLFEPSYTRSIRYFHRCASAIDMSRAVDQSGAAEERWLDLLPVHAHYGVGRLEHALGLTTTRLKGAKIGWCQLFSHFDPFEFFLRYRDARYVILYRESVVDAMCSRMIAKRTRLWHSETERHDKLAPFSVSTERAERYITDYILHQELGRTLLRTMGARHVEITYEQLMDETKDTLSHISTFLEIEEIRNYSRLRKIVPQPYREFITNYDELVDIEKSAKGRVHG